MSLQTKYVTLIGGPAHGRQEVIAEGSDRRIRVPVMDRVPSWTLGEGPSDPLAVAFDVVEYSVIPYENRMGERFYVGFYEGRTSYSREDWRTRAERAERKLKDLADKLDVTSSDLAGQNLRTETRLVNLTQEARSK